MSARPLRFRDFLPEIFRVDEVNGVSFLSRFLQPVEELFEELQAEIEGAPDRSAGGLPDLLDPNSTPPAQFLYRPPGEADDADRPFLQYLASWVGLSLRTDRPTAWNRDFVSTAMSTRGDRGTLPYMDALLRAWLHGDIVEGATNAPLVVLSDLTPRQNNAQSILQLDQAATLDVDSVLGVGPTFFFIADVVTTPSVAELRNPAGLDGLQRAARALLDAEKPVHTRYQLRVRAQTMQLAPERAEERRPGEVYAQFEDVSSTIPVSGTALLIDAPWIFDSD